MQVSVCELLHCDSAAVASVGATSLLCTATLEVMQPLTSQPEQGALTADCQLTPLCKVDSADFTFGRASPLSAAVSARLQSLLLRAVRLDELSIQPGAAAWALHVDVLVTSYDGALMDAALAAAHAALDALRLPDCELTETGEVVLLGGGGQGRAGRPLSLPGRSVCSTFAAVGRCLLLDPSAEELELSDATLSVTVGADGRLLDVWKAGGAVLSRDEVQQCIALAKQRSAQQLLVIDSAWQQHNRQSRQST